MRRASLEDLPEEGIPDGFELRTLLGGDIARWAELMTGAIGDWDEELARRQFLGEPGVEPEGVFFLTCGDEYVATATDKRLRLPTVGYLHMVAVAPSHRGRRLGRCISLAALRRMRERGCTEAILDTDDYRVAAIRTYLSLGFAPQLMESDHVERWRRILADVPSD